MSANGTRSRKPLKAPYSSSVIKFRPTSSRDENKASGVSALSPRRLSNKTKASAMMAAEPIAPRLTLVHPLGPAPMLRPQTLRPRVAVCEDRTQYIQAHRVIVVGGRRNDG